MIEWLLEHFGGTEKLSGTPKHEGCPSQWAWVVRGRRAAPIIAGILPYLVVKVGQARLAEAFLATYDDPQERTELNAARLSLKEQITALNCLKGKSR
jgi:hypothetical protein